MSKEKKIVYVVTTKWVMDFEQGFSFEIFEKKADAVKHFNDEVRDIKTDYNDLPNPVVEDSEEYSYLIYEDGYYNRTHGLVSLVEKEIS